MGWQITEMHLVMTLDTHTQFPTFTYLKMMSSCSSSERPAKHGLPVSISVSIRVKVRVTVRVRVKVTCDHFDENTPHRPHIYCGGVIGSAQQNFWRAVPQRDHLMGHVRGIVVDRESPRESKVGKFQLLMFADQDVGRLKVAVHNAGAVAICQSRCELLQKFLCIVC